VSDVSIFKNPFPGPQPYRAADRDRFFGRDTLVKKLANQLLARSATTLFGPSGAGKSSLMQAGVIPRLQETHDFQVVRVDGWPAAQPPLSWLVQAIHADLGLGEPSADKSGLDALDEAMMLAERRSDQPILIYLDQLEQLLFPERPEQDAEDLMAGVDRLAHAPIQGLQMVLSLREDYLGRFRDRARDRKELLAHGFRLGPLTVGEMVKSVCRAADTGTPPQKWDPTQLLGLMREVRVPGQAAADEAEVQAAYGQIVCRALFQQRHQGESAEGEIQAEAILRRYLDTTLGKLGPLAPDAQRLLEDHLVTADGSRTLRTENELLRVLPQEKLGPILRELEGAAILHAEAHQGSRYFEIGHDWLARKVYEERQLRERQEEQRRREREQAEALRIHRAQIRKYATIAVVSVAIAAGAAGMGIFARAQQIKAEQAGRAAVRARKIAEAAEDVAKKKAIEASDARLLAGFRELKHAGQLGWATKLLAEVQEPLQARGWLTLATDALDSNALETTLYVHEKPLRAVAWSPDGKRALTASADGTARIWDASGRGMPIVLAGHDKPLTTAAWSPDGSLILTGSEDGTLRVWRVDGTDKPTIIDHHAGPIMAAAFDARGKRIIAITTAKDAFICNVDGREVFALKGHGAPLTSAAFFPDGNHILTTSLDGTARVWAIDARLQSVVFRGHTDEVLFAAPSPDGSKFLTASRDDTARIWDAVRPGAPIVLSGHERTVVHAAWSPDGKRIATTSADGTARVWPADGKTDVVVLSGHSAAVEFVSWRPDGKYVATAARDQTVRIWPAEGGTPFILAGHDAPVRAAFWNHDGSRLLTAAGEDEGRPGDSAARIWHPTSLESLPRERPAFYHAAFIQPGGEFIVAAYDDFSLRLFRVDGSGEPISWKNHNAWVTSVALSPDGTRIVSTSVDKTARITRRDGTGQSVVLVGAESPVRFAAWSPNGDRIVTVSDDTRARIHQVNGQGDTLIFSGHEDAVVHASWSPDGKRIVTTSLDHSARVWNADESGDSLELKGHEAPVVFAAWSPDGQRIVTTSDDGYAQVFGAKNGDVLAMLGHSAAVLVAAWSPDGKRIATTTQKGGLYLWEADGKSEPVVMETSAPILAMTFVSDERILTVAADDTTRWYTVGVNALKQGLVTTNHDCLPAEMRITYLGEATEKAAEKHAECQRGHGRMGQAEKAGPR